MVSWIRSLCWRLALALATWKIRQKCEGWRMTMVRLLRFGCGFLSLQMVDLSGIHSLGNGEKRAQQDVRLAGERLADDHYPLQQGENRKRQEQRKEQWARLLLRCRNGAGRWPSLGAG
jgi:hypothetical protein